jgi:hypothetical protein
MASAATCACVVEMVRLAVFINGKRLVVDEFDARHHG